MAHPIETMITPPSGDFLSQERRNPVVTETDEFDPRVIYDRNGVKISKGFVELDDGIVLETAFSELDPNRIVIPEGQEGLASYGSAAWITQADGVYIRELIANARHGFAGTIVGPPENMWRLYNPTDNGRNLLEVARWQAELLGRDEEYIRLKGVSQGFHNGAAALTQAAAHGFVVTDADLRAGCLPLGITAELLKSAPKKIANELLSLPEIAKTPKRALVHYMKTLDFTKRGTYTHWQSLAGLLSGQLGWHLDHLPESTVAHLSSGAGDFMGDHEVTNKKVARYPYVSTSNNGRSHFDDAVGHDRFEAWRERDATMGNVFAENPHLRSMPVDIMRKRLYELACEQNPQFVSNS